MNIAGIQLGRIDDSNRAISIISMDGPVPADTVEAIRGISEVVAVRPATIEA